MWGKEKIELAVSCSGCRPVLHKSRGLMGRRYLASHVACRPSCGERAGDKICGVDGEEAELEKDETSVVRLSLPSPNKSPALSEIRLDLTRPESPNRRDHGLSRDEAGPPATAGTLGGKDPPSRTPESARCGHRAQFVGVLKKRRLRPRGEEHKMNTRARHPPSFSALDRHHLVRDHGRRHPSRAVLGRVRRRRQGEALPGRLPRERHFIRVRR